MLKDYHLAKADHLESDFQVNRELGLYRRDRDSLKRFSSPLDETNFREKQVLLS